MFATVTVFFGGLFLLRLGGPPEQVDHAHDRNLEYYEEKEHWPEAGHP